MMTRFAPLTSVITALALLLSLLGHGYAQAQQQGAQLHELVICGENGIETLMVDSQGKPVDPDACTGGLCPECLRLGGLQTPPLPVVAMASPMPPRIIGRPAAPVLINAPGKTAAMPRAPPLQARV